jgi:hypothetical protein
MGLGYSKRSQVVNPASARGPFGWFAAFPTCFDSSDPFLPSPSSRTDALHASISQVRVPPPPCRLPAGVAWVMDTGRRVI